MTHLQVAVSVGGQAERAPGDAGGFLPAVAGYDPDGHLLAGEAGLADATSIGSADLVAAPDATDRRGAGFALRLAALVETARRRLTVLTRRLVTGAVMVVPEGADSQVHAVLFQAIESGGLEVLRLVGLDEARARAGSAEDPVLGAAWLAEDMR